MRVLIVRTSAMGDVVHALPVLTALRRHLPEAKIGWVVEESMAPLLQGHPDLDELLVVRLRHWRRSLAAQTLSEMRSFLSTLNCFAPDAVLDLMGNHKAGVISALTLADRRIGFARTSRREPSSAIWNNEPLVPRGVHAVDRMLSLLDALDLPAEPADFGNLVADIAHEVSLKKWAAPLRTARGWETYAAAEDRYGQRRKVSM